MFGSWLVGRVVMLVERDPRSHYLFDPVLEGAATGAWKGAAGLACLDLRHISPLGVAGPIRKRTIWPPRKPLPESGQLKID
jgi:hypothetical protein